MRYSFLQYLLITESLDIFLLMQLFMVVSFSDVLKKQFSKTNVIQCRNEPS